MICKDTFDAVTKMNAKPPKCEMCGGSTRKLMSAPKVARVAGPSGAIWDTRQIKDSHGENWRYTKGAEHIGGSRRKLFFHD
jgi:predicted nucleic acid-binding Zn ribbon protein